MPKTKFVDFKAVKAAVTMEQVLEHYGLLDKFKRGADSLSGACPIHKGSNPTQFRVSISKNIWNCFSECKHGGNTLDFIARMDDVSIHAAALKAIEWFNLDPEAMSANEGEETPGDAPKSATPPAPAPKKPAPAAEKSTPNTPLKFRLDKLERSHPYLAERGLTLETIVDFGVGFCAKGMMADRIAIPIQNTEGKVVAYAGRFPGEPPDEDTPKYKLPQGFRKSQELFNIDRAIKEPADKPLVIVEGFFGCMKLHQFGCRKVVALMGSTMSGTQEELIRQHTDRKSQVIVMLDEDEAGKTGSEDTAPHFNPECECMVVLMLNTRRRVKGHQFLSIGTMDTILVHPREVFRCAIIAAAAAIALIHNHPSGDPTPSEADVKVTRDLIRAGQLLKLELIDHVVIGHSAHSSLRELGYCAV